MLQFHQSTPGHRSSDRFQRIARSFKERSQVRALGSSSIRLVFSVLSAQLVTDWLDFQPSSLAISRMKPVCALQSSMVHPQSESVEEYNDGGDSALDIKFGLDVGPELPPVAERGL